VLYAPVVIKEPLGFNPKIYTKVIPTIMTKLSTLTNTFILPPENQIKLKTLNVITPP
jgi:hypothetical protein